ncbi:hypothetical protein FA13DRAFT_1715924 [Coprinellus micaceus]|uniref:Uncharacterized protein n=1 Tax=Coprinellus micaceus TaxID=71717 RepID=A0A4Y7SL50_COPMI|nr:hypothetical protein FA13DRAFT_1715924 [Coprinellus micaceus]
MWTRDASSAPVEASFLNQSRVGAWHSSILLVSSESTVGVSLDSLPESNLYGGSVPNNPNWKSGVAVSRLRILQRNREAIQVDMTAFKKGIKMRELPSEGLWKEQEGDGRAVHRMEGQWMEQEGDERAVHGTEGWWTEREGDERAVYRKRMRVKERAYGVQKGWYMLRKLIWEGGETEWVYDAFLRFGMVQYSFQGWCQIKEVKLTGTQWVLDFKVHSGSAPSHVPFMCGIGGVEPGLDNIVTIHNEVEL